MKACLVDWPNQLNIDQIADTFGSPSWIVHEGQIEKNVEKFEIFTGSTNNIFFPVKTNPSLTVLQIFAKLGVGADCATKSEVDLALFAGVNIHNISYNCPVQDIHLCKSLLIAGAIVVMDDLEAMIALQIEMKDIYFTGKIFLRINLSGTINYSKKIDNQELMAHGNSSSKFGIPIEEVEKILTTINLPISGLHVHVGTQMDNMMSFEYAIVEMNSLAERLLHLGHSISMINMGGGLGIPFQKDDEFPSLDYWVSQMSRLKNNRFVYSVEPGHALIGNAVALLTKILTIKNSRGKKWAIVDVGTDQLAKITLLKWPHRIFDAAGKELPEGIDAIAGPLCFAGDTLLENRSINHLKTVDHLIVAEVGAYTYSLSNRFNGRLAPKWLIVKKNGKVIQTISKENNSDNFQLINFDWNFDSNKISRIITSKELSKLSSDYLSEQCSFDTYSFEKVVKLNINKYEFQVSTTSKADFISMPFAIRIFGDAAIISVLHNDGVGEKKVPVWGKKLVLDCFNQIKSNELLKFSITISEPVQKEVNTIRIVRFRTECKRFSGSLFIQYKNNDIVLEKKNITEEIKLELPC